MSFVNADGRVIIAVDNSTSGVGNGNFGRNSLYLSGMKPVTLGSLLIFDVNHIPTGCSVWPGFFLKGQGVWPTTGEIDIIEGDISFVHTTDEQRIMTKMLQESTCRQIINIPFTPVTSTASSQPLLLPTKLGASRPQRL